MLAVAPAFAQSTQQFYGANGDYLGTALPSGPNARVYYDAQGNVAATGMKAGRNTMFYGSNGDYLGTATNTSPNVDE
jgi:YD repeat-containing protein